MDLVDSLKQQNSERNNGMVAHVFTYPPKYNVYSNHENKNPWFPAYWKDLNTKQQLWYMMFQLDF